MTGNWEPRYDLGMTGSEQPTPKRATPGTRESALQRLDELAAKIAADYADVPEEVGIAEIEAAVQAVRHSDSSPSRSLRS